MVFSISLFKSSRWRCARNIAHFSLFTLFGNFGKKLQFFVQPKTNDSPENKPQPSDIFSSSNIFETQYGRPSENENFGPLNTVPQWDCFVWRFRYPADIQHSENYVNFCSWKISGKVQTKALLNSKIVQKWKRTIRFTDFFTTKLFYLTKTNIYNKVMRLETTLSFAKMFRLKIFSQNFKLNKTEQRMAQQWFDYGKLSHFIANFHLPNQDLIVLHELERH